MTRTTSARTTSVRTTSVRTTSVRTARVHRTGGPSDHVVVVGAGLAGLSAAMHLTGAGRRVTVLEREATPGGRAARVTRSATGGGAYHLDTGPTVLTMPDLFADCFAAIGQSLDDWVTLLPIDPAYRAEFADGTGLSLTCDIDRMAERIAAFSGAADARGYRSYVDFVTRLYRLQVRDFIDRNFDSPLDLVGASLARLAAMRGFARLAPTVARYFRDERLQRIFSFQAMYAGVSPQQALAVYSVISYMDLVEGVFYPIGGMNALPTAMAGAAEKAGVEFAYDTTVSGVRWCTAPSGLVSRSTSSPAHRRAGRVVEVTSSDGRSWSPDALVVTADVPAALDLLGWPGRRPGATLYSPSCVVLAAGLDRTWPGPARAEDTPSDHTTSDRAPSDHATSNRAPSGHAPSGHTTSKRALSDHTTSNHPPSNNRGAHHTMHFGRAWAEVFDDLAAGRLMRDPSFLVSIPTTSDPGLAPEGRSTAYVLFPAPNLDHHPPLDWTTLREPYRQHMVRTVERAGYEGFGDAIDAEVLITPQDWADRGMAMGTPFAAAHTFGQTGPFRTANLVADNVVLAGSGTVPGVGVPMVLISGRLAAERITGADPAYRSSAWR